MTTRPTHCGVCGNELEQKARGRPRRTCLNSCKEAKSKRQRGAASSDLRAYAAGRRAGLKGRALAAALHADPRGYKLRERPRVQPGADVVVVWLLDGSACPTPGCSNRRELALSAAGDGRMLLQDRVLGPREGPQGGWTCGDHSGWIWPDACASVALDDLEDAGAGTYVPGEVLEVGDPCLIGGGFRVLWEHVGESSIDPNTTRGRGAERGEALRAPLPRSVAAEGREAFVYAESHRNTYRRFVHWRLRFTGTDALVDDRLVGFTIPDWSPLGGAGKWERARPFLEAAIAVRLGDLVGGCVIDPIPGIVAREIDSLEALVGHPVKLIAEYTLPIVPSLRPVRS